MRIVVTGAAGHLGRLVVQGLLERVPADGIIAVVRSEEKGVGLEALGVRIAVADYNVPETFEGLFAAGDKVLLISSSEMGRDRVAQHKVVVDAARTSGVALLAYTSAAGTHETPLAEAHRGTEKVLVESGLPYVLLRNNWYSEIFVDGLDRVVEHGVLVRAAGEGRIASATRADYAAGAVAVLTGTGHENRAYELSGDRAWSFAEFAAELGGQTGREIVYTPVEVEAYVDLLTGAGMPALYAEILAGAEASFAKGELAGANGDLARLIGRPTTPIADTIAAALRRDEAGGRRGMAGRAQDRRWDNRRAAHLGCAHGGRTRGRAGGVLHRLHRRQAGGSRLSRRPRRAVAAQQPAEARR
ncbi:SDR family oxidoreductase [Streptomyces phaeolivaceus]|uniref:SDR family oxidoreductase n=1 Tax=Streptomyces phaeolivaceus TaxID=2653200 RepID=A0A5P8K6A2_9ACTN|nr:SDR family oxidoreductase [Streptomyces phaeolivaceus]